MSLIFYVYWTVHHLDSWIKIGQLDVTCFFISLFNARHVSDVNTSILRSLRHICWVISWIVLIWYDACWCYVVVWMRWCGIRMQASACIRIPHQCQILSCDTLVANERYINKPSWNKTILRYFWHSYGRFYVVYYFKSSLRKSLYSQYFF